MALDDADTIRRFISQMQAERENSNLTNLTSPSTAQHDRPANEHAQSIDTANSVRVSEDDKSEGSRTPPHAILTGQDHFHLTSPEAHPKPSPHISGLKAPYNTPKTAASSPRLAATNTHNEDVAEAFSDYVNKMDGRPLSESMWAPGSARYQSSMLSRARSTRALTPIKAVEPNPDINETFDRMSFKAADPDPKVAKNLIGDRVTQSLFSKAPPAFVNKFSVLTEKTQGDEVDDVQAKLEVTRDEDVEPQAPTEAMEEVQAKDGGASEDDLSNTAHSDKVEKENVVPSTSKANVPPHLRAARDSSHKPVKVEKNLPGPEGPSPLVTSKIADPGPIEDVVLAPTKGLGPKVTTSTADARSFAHGSSESEDLEHKTVFNSWPKQEERSRPAAKIRKVIIKDLPRGSTATFVASLVYGGPIEEIHIRSSPAGDLSAMVRFMDAGDCIKFYDATSNGLVYDKDAKGRELVLFVELSKDVDVVGGLLQGWIASGVTRCVRAVGVAAEWGTDGLVKIAERKNRKVEKIVDGQNAGGARSVVFRFCKVDDAVQFRAALSRDEGWEHCNVHYATDPCATASGVHLEG